jgi:hypothetical protein
MNTRLALSLLALTAAVSLTLMLHRQNIIVSGGDSGKGYFSVTWGTPETANGVMNGWRQESKKTDALKTMVSIDYVLIVVYCLYLCTCLYGKAREEKRPWLRSWLRVAVGLILVGALIDAIQDHKMVSYTTSRQPVADLRGFTWAKWAALGLGVIPLFISLFPPGFAVRMGLKKGIRWLSEGLKSIWTFFPALLFLILGVFCFWLAGQGKDIIVAFAEPKPNPVIPVRFIFFLAIGFWVYVTWYSSRVIAYIKQRRQQAQMEKANPQSAVLSEQAYRQGDDFFDIGKNFLDEFPRAAGNACFLVLELAVWQSPILISPIHSFDAIVIFFLAMINIHFLDRWIRNTWSYKSYFAALFWASLIIFLGLLIATPIFGLATVGYMQYLFWLLLVFHGVFIFYINLRRAQLQRRASGVGMKQPVIKVTRPTWLERKMDYFCIPPVETGYVRWFLCISGTGLVVYGAAIFFLWFARGIGPFPILILAFGVLLAFGNAVTALSVRYRLNIHFLLFLLAFVIGMKETHYVRKIDLKNSVNGYTDRPTLKTYLTEWLKERIPLTDTAGQSYDMYFVLANGGASRSGYWSASVLGKLEDSSISSRQGRFSDHLFCLSGTSGGGVGVATFFSLLRNKQGQPNKMYAQSAAHFLQQDYFSYTLARMLGPDFFKYIVPLVDDKDRGAALEESFEESSQAKDSSDYPIPFYDTLSHFKALDGNGKIALPILFVNTTRMQDGNPGVVTNIMLEPDLFNQRVDVLHLLDTNMDISMASGAILGSRFPYLSPAGRIGEAYFVDGGYFDNSGAGVVQETIRGILNLAKEDSIRHGVLCKQVARLRFRILHIVNSPLDLGSPDLKSVAPIKNDLLAPVLTIVGTYDMQTTVNDRRLYNYIDDINKFSNNKADHTLISLYENEREWLTDSLCQRFDTEPPYSMNWFMSDTTSRRMANRLVKQPALNELISQMK